MKHKIQINNKNVYLLFTITGTRTFYFIKRHPYEKYSNANHFVSKRIQNRKEHLKNLICMRLSYTLFKFISRKGHSDIDWCVMRKCGEIWYSRVSYSCSHRKLCRVSFICYIVPVFPFLHQGYPSYPGEFSLIYRISIAHGMVDL
jgi:hypothetical protein